MKTLPSITELSPKTVSSLNLFKSGLLLAQPCVRVKGTGRREKGLFIPFFKGERLRKQSRGFLRILPIITKLSPKTFSFLNSFKSGQLLVRPYSPPRSLLICTYE